MCIHKYYFDLRLVKYYNKHVPEDQKVSEKAVLEEWQVVKGFLMEQEDSKSNLEHTLCNAEQVLRMIKMYLCHPTSNAAVERGFSLMNNIKSHMRTRMNDDLPDASLAVKFNGADPNSMSTDSTFFKMLRMTGRIKRKGYIHYKYHIYRRTAILFNCE